MARPRSPDGRVMRNFLIPPELNEWLTAASAEQAERLHVEPSRSRLVTEALSLLRDLMEGTPSKTSKRLLDDALSRLDVPEMQHVGDLASKQRSREKQRARRAAAGG